VACDACSSGSAGAVVCQRWEFVEVKVHHSATCVWVFGGTEMPGQLRKQQLLICVLSLCVALIVERSSRECCHDSSHSHSTAMPRDAVNSLSCCRHQHQHSPAVLSYTEPLPMLPQRISWNCSCFSSGMLSMSPPSAEDK
jgi:hypothetical protein